MLEFSLEDVYMFLYIYFFAPLFLLNGCDPPELEKDNQKSRNTTNLTNITITNTNKNSQPYTNFYTIVDSSCTFHVGAFASDMNITRFSIDISENVIFSTDTFYKCIKLQNVSIGDSATSINDYAFYKCSNLTDVSFGVSVKTIGYKAFQGCSSLENMSIPASVASIGASAFYQCSNLTDVSIPDSVNSIILRKTFAECSNLTDVSIGNSVKTIDYYAFWRCESLTDVTIPDSATSINDYAFEGCDNLETITIGKSVESIGYIVFSSCSKLTTVTIPESVTSINHEAFTKSSIENIYFTENVIAFGTFGLKTVNIGKKIWFRGRRMFLRKSESSKNVSTGTTEEITFNDSSGVLTKKIISDSDLETYKDTKKYKVTINKYSSIGDRAFHLYPNLVEASIGESIESIGASAFSYCPSMTIVTIGDNVTSIGNKAFQGCSSLENMSIPASVKSIGSEAFQGCSSLENMSIPASVKSIGNKAFSGCSSLENMSIPASVKIIGKYTFLDCSGLENVSIPNSVDSISDSAFQNCSGLKTVTLGLYVTLSIGNDAFNGCSSLSSINQFFGINTLPKYVMSIGNRAFYKCTGLENMSIPGVLTSIGDQAFALCSSLKTVTLGTEVKTIGKKAFRGCSSLSSINQFFGINNLPRFVTSIGDNAFQGCTNLTNVTIPESVKTIGTNAFLNSGITDMYVTEYAFNNGKFGLNKLPKDINGRVQFRGKLMEIKSLPSFKTTTTDASNDTIIFQNGGPLTKTDVSNSGLTRNTNIKYVYIEHHTSIGSEAFLDCSHIEKITIPATVTDISENAFNNAFNRDLLDTKIVVDVFNKKYRMEDAALYRNTPERIGSRLIKLPIASDHSNFTSYNIPEYTHSIADYAFYNCSNIQTITVPPLVRSIGTDAFKTNTDRSNNNVTINMSSFTLYYLNKYYDLSISPDFSYNSIETLYTAKNFFGAERASLNITLDTEFLINTSDSSNILKPIDVSGNKKNVVVSNYQSIAANCFKNNNNMKYIALENSIDCSLNTIGSGAFANCSNLQQVLYADQEHIDLYNNNKDQEYKIQSAFNTINDLSGNEDVSGIFQNCRLLTAFYIPKNVPTIPHYAFKDCHALFIVHLTENTKTIHKEAFENCYTLWFINLLSVTSLELNIMGDGFLESLESITIPNKLDNITDSDLAGLIADVPNSKLKNIKKQK